MKDLLNVLLTVAVLSIAYGAFFKHAETRWEARVEQTLQDAAAWEAQVGGASGADAPGRGSLGSPGGGV
jgi:hypothetical protein